MRRRVFIGSSSKAKNEATIIRGILREFGAEAVVWFDTEAFPPSMNTIDTLLKDIHFYDAAVFVLNEDDELAKRESPVETSYVTRDNVLIEAGMSMSAFGKESVLLVKVGGVHIPSDFKGITHVSFCTDDDSHQMREKISTWYKHLQPHQHCEGNVLIQSRRELHHRYSLDSRLHISDELYKHIESIRIMCFCGNSLIDPDYSYERSYFSKDVFLPDAFNTILRNTDASVKLILTEPTKYNLLDINTKVANNRAGDSKGALYSSLSSLYHLMYVDKDSALYKAKQRPIRFHFSVLRVSMPFAIFNIEYAEEYKEYNHVKVDLYSAALGDEDDRRSFIIWSDSDPLNYRFFVDNFNKVFHSKELCWRPKKADMKLWADQWNKMLSADDYD